MDKTIAKEKKKSKEDNKPRPLGERLTRPIKNALVIIILSILAGLAKLFKI